MILIVDGDFIAVGDGKGVAGLLAGGGEGAFDQLGGLSWRVRQTWGRRRAREVCRRSHWPDRRSCTESSACSMVRERLDGRGLVGRLRSLRSCGMPSVIRMSMTDMTMRSSMRVKPSSRGACDRNKAVILGSMALHVPLVGSPGRCARPILGELRTNFISRRAARARFERAQVTEEGERHRLRDGRAAGRCPERRRGDGFDLAR
jgi:hypothetical protein